MPRGEHAPGGQPGARTGPAALELRVAGASLTHIAQVLGLAGARQAIEVIERELASHVDATTIEAARELASQQLDTLLASVWPRATDREDPEHLTAVRVAERLIDRRVRLHGLDRPTEVLVHTPTETELQAWVARIVGLNDPDVEEADIIDIEPDDIHALGP